MVASFPLFTAGGGINVSVIPLTSTFIVKTNGLNAYQAFVTGGSALTPQYSESNFTKIINDDILGGTFCTNGCSATLDPGSYNQTKTIQVTKNFAMFGTGASIIFSQVGFNNMNFNVSSASFIWSGPRIDDFNRRFVLGTCPNLTQVNCHVGIAEFGANCNINNAQFFNETASGIYLTKASMGCNVSFNTIVGIPNQFTNATQPPSIGIVGSGSSHRISNNIVSYFRGGAGVQLGSGTINNALHSFAVENTLFHNEYGVQTISAIDMHINDNTIYNSTGPGILVNTAIVPSTFGPLTISGNNIGESSQGLCCGVSSGTAAHITLQGNRCCWKTVSVTGNTLNDRNTTLTTKTGIEVVSVNYENLTITGNAIGKTVNPTTIILDVNPPDKSWIITANPGFNAQPVRGPLTAGATPFTYTNDDAYMEQLAIITLGDSTSLVCRGITQILTAGETTPVLNTLDTCIFTYVVTAPTYDVLPLQG